jgi:hypothetical protein
MPTVSLQAQLRQAKRQLAEQSAAHKIALDAAEKAATQHKASAAYNLDIANKAKNELDQAHALLDALPNAIPRQGSNPGDWRGPTEHALATRLAAWLATNRN